MSLWIGNKEVGLAPGQTGGVVEGSYVERPAGSDVSKAYIPGTGSTSIMIEGGATAGRGGTGIGGTTIVQRDQYGNVIGVRRTGTSGETVFERKTTRGGGYVEEGLPFGVQSSYAEIERTKSEIPLYRKQAEYRAREEAKRQQESISPTFKLPILPSYRYGLPKRTFTVLEGRTATEYYKTYPSIPKAGTPRISEPLQSFGRNIFGQEQGEPLAGKTYRKDWFGTYKEVSPIKAKVTTKEHLEAIKTSDVYAPLFVAPGVFSSTSVLRGASLNIRFPKTNIKSTIKSTGKSAWANSLEMLRDTSATTGRKVTTAEITKPFSIPTKEDIFGKPRSVYYERAQGEAARGETRGGYARTWETRFEAGLKPKARPQEPSSFPTWREAYESKQTGRRMLESWAMRKYKGLPSLKNLRPSKYPLTVYKPKIKGTEVSQPSLSQSFKQALKPISKPKYRPMYGLGFLSAYSTRTDTRTNIKPITYPMFKTPTITGAKTRSRQALGYNFKWSLPRSINIPSYRPPTRQSPRQPPKIPPKQPPREPPMFRPPPKPIVFKMPSFEIPSAFGQGRKMRYKTKEKTIYTRMLQLSDILRQK